MIKGLNKKYLEELINLNELAFKPLEKELGKYKNKGVKEYFEFTLKNGKIFGYFIDKKIVACAGIVINKKYRYGEVEHLLVNPKFQGKGIAKELMNFIEQYAKNKKIRELRLNVRCKNNKAVGFYKRLNYFEHAHIMLKKLK